MIGWPAYLKEYFKAPYYNSFQSVTFYFIKVNDADAIFDMPETFHCKVKVTDLFRFKFAVSS